MGKLKLLLVLLVSSCTSALLHSGDDWDVWEHWLRQQILLAAGRGFSQQRSAVPLGQTLSVSFSLWDSGTQPQ